MAKKESSVSLKAPAAALSQGASKSTGEKLWDFFSSVKMAIVLLVIFAVLCTIGSLIPQNETPASYGRNYLLFKTLGLVDIYHTWWFEILLALISLNLILSNCNRAERIIQSFYRPEISRPPGYFKNHQKKVEWQISGDSATAKEKILAVLSKLGYHCRVGEPSSGFVSYYAERYRIGNWGSFVAHLGILIVFMGALYGNFPGVAFRKQMAVAEGETFHAPLGNFDIHLRKFTVKCDEMRNITLFQSDVDVLEEGKKVLSKEIKVNHPLAYKDLVFYQSDWGLAGIVVQVTDPRGKKKEHYLPLTGGQLPEPGFFVLQPAGWLVLVQDFAPDLVINSNGEPMNASNMPLNPAAQLFISERKDSRDPRDFKPGGILNDKEAVAYKGYQFIIKEIPKYSGFQVKKDPGVPVVYLGFFILTVGAFLSLYVSHRLLRIGVQELPGKLEITFIPVRTDREQTYDMEIEKLKAALAAS